MQVHTCPKRSSIITVLVCASRTCPTCINYHCASLCKSVHVQRTRTYVPCNVTPYATKKPAWSGRDGLATNFLCTSHIPRVTLHLTPPRSLAGLAEMVWQQTSCVPPTSPCNITPYATKKPGWSDNRLPVNRLLQSQLLERNTVSPLEACCWNRKLAY